MGEAQIQDLYVSGERAFPRRRLEREKINENPSPPPPRHNVAAMRTVMSEDHQQGEPRLAPTSHGQHCRGGEGVSLILVYIFPRRLPKSLHHGV